MKNSRAIAFLSIALFTAALLVPVVASYALSRHADLLWLLGASTFSLIAVTLILSLGIGIRNRLLGFLLCAVFAFLLFSFEIARLTSYYLQGEGFNERFYYHLEWSTIAECWNTYPFLLYTTSFSLAVFLLFLFLSLYSLKRSFSSGLRKRLLLPLFVLAIFLPSPVREFFEGYEEFSIAEVSVAFDELSKIGFDVRAISQIPTPAKAGKNLLLIYLESLEQLFMERELFYDLTPYLQEQAATQLSFSNLRQVKGTGWTVGGMVASQCGTPLLLQTRSHGNDLLQNKGLSNVTCLGDVLHRAGYQQTYLGGAGLVFAGKGEFYKAHSYDKVLGFEELKGAIKGNENYRHNWGLFDDTMFKLAVEEFTRLADGERPFNLTLLTLDTHDAGDSPSNGCPDFTRMSNNGLDLVHCTDFLVKKFIAEISKHPRFEDTIVVLFSDHLAMRSFNIEEFTRNYDRKLFLTVLNSEQRGVVDRPGTHMDVAPTILELLEVKHSTAFFAGSSLLRNEIERKQINFDKKDIQKLIRSVNSSYFSQSKGSLCAAEYLLQYASESELSIGNRKLALAYRGDPYVFATQFPSGELSVLVLLGERGEIIEKSVVPSDRVPRYLEKANAAYYLVLGKSRIFSKEMQGVSSGTVDGYQLYFGEKSKEARVLGSFSQLEEIEFSADCSSLFGEEST